MSPKLSTAIDIFACWPHRTQCSWWRLSPVQSLLRLASLHQTGNDLQEDPATRGSEPLNRIWNRRTSVLPTRGRRQPLENTGIPLWTRLRSRRVCHEDRVIFRRVAGKLFETRGPVLPKHSFSRRKWHASVEQRVSCRHVEISVHYFKKRSGNQLRTFWQRFTHYTNILVYKYRLRVKKKYGS